MGKGNKRKAHEMLDTHNSRSLGTIEGDKRLAFIYTDGSVDCDLECQKVIDFGFLKRYKNLDFVIMNHKDATGLCG